MEGKKTLRKRYSSLEWHFFLILQAEKIEGFVKDYKFHPTRRWKIDFCNPETKVGVELEGGIFTNGRHTRGAGYQADTEKYNEITKTGIRLLRYCSKEQMRNFKEDYNSIINNGSSITRGN